METIRFKIQPTIIINGYPYYIGYTKLAEILDCGDRKAMFFNDDLAYLKDGNPAKDCKLLKFVVANELHGKYKLVVVEYNDYWTTVYLSQALSSFDIQWQLSH
jgi:hypothetical protein